MLGPDRTAEEFAKAWLVHTTAAAGSDGWYAAKWVVAASTLWPSECPERLWAGIKLILRHDLGSEVLSDLGIGPLENLLARHFEEFVNLGLELTDGDQNFLTALESAYVEEEDEQRLDQILGR